MEKELNNILQKYNWSYYKKSESEYDIYNKKNLKVAIIKFSANKYIIYDSDGKNKLMSGKGQIADSVEKLLTKYFYATPISLKEYFVISEKEFTDAKQKNKKLIEEYAKLNIPEKNDSEIKKIILQDKLVKATKLFAEVGDVVYSLKKDIIYGIESDFKEYKIRTLNKNENTLDYDMPIHEVERIAKISSNHSDFYEQLEDYIKQRANRNNEPNEDFSGGGNVYNRGKRPSPKESATLYDEGYEMEGQDGNMYRIVVDKNGRHSWKLCKDCEEKNIKLKNDNMETEKENIPESKFKKGQQVAVLSAGDDKGYKIGTIKDMKYFSEPAEITGETGWLYHVPEYGDIMISEKMISEKTLPERKFHKSDIVIDESDNKYMVTGELQYNERFKDYDVMVVDADIPVNKIYKEYIFSEKNLKKYVNTLENQGGEKFEIGKKSEYNIFKGIDYTYDNLFQLNKAIEELIDKKVKYSVLQNGLITIISNSLTSDELVFANSYVGYGGLEKFGATGLGLLYEYYTPDQIIKMMWALAYKYGGDPKSILEPSCAAGRFFKYAPKASLITGYEINIYSALICKLLYENAAIYHKYFEQVFLKNNTSLKSKIYELPKYDLVIGNPPYGDISQGASKWFAMGEDKYSHATNYIDYFIFRGIDLLIDGGLLIYVVGAEKHAGGSLFLEKGMNKTKELIAEKADLLDAYKLPAKLFQTTGVSSEIIVLKKK